MPLRHARAVLTFGLALSGALLAGAAEAGTKAAHYATLAPALATEHLAGGAATSAPVGFVRFCGENTPDCTPAGAPIADMALDTRKLAELEQVNRSVNDAVEPVTDLDHYGETERWAYPMDGRGDCEDYVLAKRRLLIDRGWPSSVLLITVVRDHEGDGHAVLMVVTDRGDLVLDNQDGKILPWHETGYRYVKRQSQADPAQWVSLGEARVPVEVGGGR